MPDDSTSTTELPPAGDAGTEPVAATPAPWEAGSSPSPAKPGSDNVGLAADDEWPVRSPKAGLRMRAPTAVLLALLIAAGGLWGGAALQRAHGSSSGSGGAAAFSRLAAGRGFNFPGSGSFGGTGGSSASSAAAGIVTVVQGNVLWVTTASGGLVKVILGKSTTFTRTSKSTTAALRPGDTVVVQGTKAKNGAVAATSVADTQAGA